MGGGLGGNLAVGGIVLPGTFGGGAGGALGRTGGIESFLGIDHPGK